MTDHILSPDGKFMWTGTEWIPAPPGVTHEIPPMVDLDPPPVSQSTDERDSVVRGGVNRNISTTAPPPTQQEYKLSQTIATKEQAAAGFKALTQEEVDELKQAKIPDAQIKLIDKDRWLLR